jgi:glycosyltransferase involved in cell wall biosynthesis
MPAHVRVAHRQQIPPARVIEALAFQDLFFLPTLGENYGHAIVDSLLAGTPVLISDQTPWRGLAAARAGWDLPLGDPAAFAAVIARAAAADRQEQAELRAGARAFGEAALDTDRTIAMTADCFNAFIGRRS